MTTFPLADIELAPDNLAAQRMGRATLRLVASLTDGKRYRCLFHSREYELDFAPLFRKSRTEYEALGRGSSGPYG